MSDHAFAAVPPAVIAVLTAFIAFGLIVASIALPGGPLIASLVLLAVRSSVRRRPGGAAASRVLLAAAVLALSVQFVVAGSYAVTSGSDEGVPVPVPSAQAG